MGALSIKLFSKKYLPLDSNNSDHQQDRELKFFLNVDLGKWIFAHKNNEKIFSHFCFMIV